MSTFEATQNMRNQHHFEVLEIDLPVITGACTLGADNGTGTPLTCDQPWADEYKTYYFTNTNAPILPSINGEPIYRCVMSIKETATELKPGDGLSSRGSLSVTLKDFDKQDPNIGSPGVTDSVKNSGTFFGKLNARQIFENKSVRLKLYRVQPDDTVDLVNGGQERSYLAASISLNKDGSWVLACKDILSLVNLGEKSWPIASGGFLRQDIDNITQAIPVDEFTDYSSAFAVRVGDEFLEITSVSNNLTSSAVLNVTVRGLQIVAPISGEVLTRTDKDDHESGDEVFICDVSDNETIDSFLSRVLIASDLPASFIPSLEWADEVAEWHASDKINTLHSETESTNTVINRVLTGFLMDMWFSTTENVVKLSAISVWKESQATLVEGKQINARSIKKVAKDNLRATRALVVYGKRNLGKSDDTSSYGKAAQFKDDSLISPALFTKHKDKQFENNFLLSKDAAVLLTQRYVSRFKFTPFERSFITDERYMTYNTGDVVDISATIDQSIYGLRSSNVRAQITKINPKYTTTGRHYDVKAITYEAAFNSGSEIVLNSPLGAVNLYILAGAPSEPVDLTFVFDGSYSFGDTAIRAGAFASGSKLTIIMVNGFDGQASGGYGGNSSSPGGDGGIVYDAQGVTSDVYFSGATPSVGYPIADGYIRAPGGGGAGGADLVPLDPELELYSGGGGGGGAGRSAGVGGSTSVQLSGTDGTNGDIIGGGGSGGLGDTSGGTGPDSATDGGDGGGWATDGQGSDASATDPAQSGGLKGSGIIDSGGIVTLFGDTPVRYINGNGSHP